ncbi:hypothetical protein N0A02_26405 [Paraburkholderia acidicola]|uniref:Antitoxin Xre/MbcA/ParS-like toxin-binding domain-containing protein n=1 Tax=Paraburkholderia acidicola TaxID=1912599 RepID=A0ABV1LVM3_9BURK
MKTEGFRVLAREILARLEKATGADAIDLLATVFAKVSAGETSDLSTEPAIVAPEKAGVESVDPLASARAHGRRFAVEQCESPDNLALLDARKYAAHNERSINEDRQSGKLYALLVPGKTRGFRYPKWQFDAEPGRLAAALRPFVDSSANCWVVHSFMMGERDALQGKSPAEIILDSSQDVKQVTDLAERDMAGEQGAL